MTVSRFRFDLCEDLRSELFRGVCDLEYVYQIVRDLDFSRILLSGRQTIRTSPLSLTQSDHNTRTPIIPSKKKVTKENNMLKGTPDQLSHSML